MIFDKIRARQPEQFLAANLFPKSCSLATFTLEHDQINLSNFTFYPLTSNENLTGIVRQFLAKVGLKSGLKVVFGLPSFWIEREKIRPEFEKPLLTLANDLKLTPLAFISQSQALGFYKYQQDQTLGHFNILQVFEKKILLEKFENGQETTSQVEDFEDLTSFDFSKIFPPAPPTTIFVFSEENFDNINNALRQFFTTQNTPQPEVLEVPKVDFAKSLATATAFDLGKLPKESQETQDFGFLKGKDVGETKKDSLAQGEVFEQKEVVGLKLLSALASQIFRSLKLLPATLTKFGRGKATLTLLAILLVVTALAAIFWFLPAAEVVVFVKSSGFGKDFEIRAAPTAAEIDSQTLVIPAQVLSVEKAGSKKTVTSGKKLLGEKAQGMVTVFNKTTAPKTFTAGTAIVGPTSLKFALIEAVTVASRSATLEGITFGKNKVKVEAANIGEASNLPASADFTFADFDNSLYSAHSDENFTGGSQKEVNVVAPEDKKRLEEELTKELKDQAKLELIAQSAGAKIEEATILAKPAKLQFDKETGAEANILTLTAKINFTVTIFSENDIDRVIAEKLKAELPTGFTSWQNAKVETTISKIENDGTLKIKTSFTADLIPAFGEAELVKAITGKSVDFAQSHILNLDNVEGVNIKVSPKLPSFLGNLPRSKSKIKLEIKAAKNK